jgi:hypothetical protein
MLAGRCSPTLLQGVQKASVAPALAWAPRRPTVSCASTQQDGGKSEGRAVLTKAPKAPQPVELIGASSNGDTKVGRTPN